MTAMAAAVAAFIITAVAGKPLSGWLDKKGLSRTAIEKKGEGFSPGMRAVPEMGGLLYLLGLIPAGLLAMLVMVFTGAGEVFSAETETAKMLAVIVCTGLIGAVGLMDDWRRARRLDSMNPLLRLVIVFAVCFAFLAAVRLSGDRSSILMIPFAGIQLDVGQGWTVIMLVMLVGAAMGGDRMRASSGQCASVALVCALGCGGVFAVFSRMGACALAFGSAGALLGLVLFVLPPEKLREGSGGAMAGCVLPVMAAIAGGAPLFILPAAIPFIFEGIYAIIKVACQAAGSGKLSADSLGQWLMDRGISGKAVTGSYAVLSLLGCVLAVAGSYLYL